MPKLLLSVLYVFLVCPLFSQITPLSLSPAGVKRCYTTEAMNEAIRNNPAIVDEWKKNGEQQYRKYLERHAAGRKTLTDTIVIPVVFHLVDEASRLAWITDRSIYDQVEMLNEAFGGVKAEKYKNVIPEEIYERNGGTPIRFVLARRTPSGDPTDGIERRVNTTPDRKKIKSLANGGLDAWDTDRYLNIWAGTLTGEDNNLLGVATFPFTTEEGPQGVVVNIASLPYTSNVSRSYYPSYSEGVTVIHEVGHFFYLWHTFGDLAYCNNDDFRIQPGWPLPEGAGPEGDDTPQEKQADNTSFGNPSMSFSDGCASEPFGEMYGSIMNYFDDRAMFMFSAGQIKRVEGCLELYRPALINSDGAIPPATSNDAYVVSITPYGSPERKAHIMNGTPLTVRIRNYGTTVLNSINLSLMVDGVMALQQAHSINLAPGKDTEINLGPVNAADGNRILKVYTSYPNGLTDDFTANDTIESFVSVVSAIVAAPYTENFSGNVFPPAGWRIWNANNDGTWTRSATSGYPEAGSATMQFRTFSGSGQLDELVMPALDMGASDSSLLSFNYAYAVYNNNTVTTWDGLEIYVSNDGGRNFELAYKKTGNFLKTVAPNTTTAFEALPSDGGKWVSEKINLTPFLNGNPLLVKFRATNAKGNNLYIDNVKVSIVSSIERDAQVTSVSGVPEYICNEMPAPSVAFRNNGKNALESVNVNYQVNNGSIVQKTWTGSLNPNTSTTYHFDQISSLPPGEYELTVFTSSPNGLDDQSPGNDTLRTRFYVMGRTSTPVVESFENPEFLPDQWILQQSGTGFSWERTTIASSDGTASAYINNFAHDMGGKPDNLISPVITGNNTYDSLFISFDYAYAPGSNYPGSRGEPEDTLEIRVTTDCGQSFTYIFNKSAENLITVADPEVKKNNPFVAGKDDWESERIYLTPVVGKSDFQVFFTSRGNHRNNLYLDNIKIFGVIVPPLLKERGYLLYPTPFNSQFIIRNFEQPVDLQLIQIYNSLGQLVWKEQYNGTAQRQIMVNTSGWARGIYTVKMSYKSKTIIDRVVKQ